MQRLKELEQKVGAIVARNKELQLELACAKEESGELLKKIEGLEASLLQQSSSSSELSAEHDTICSTIDGLLESIDSLRSEESLEL